jgi:hypothetical protein
MFTSHKPNLPAEEKKDRPPTTLFTCMSNPDGYGDIHHLADTYHCYKQQHQIDNKQTFILITYYKDKKAITIQKMQEHKLISPATTAEDNWLIIHAKNPNLFLIALDRSQSLEDDEGPTYTEIEHEQLLKADIFREKLQHTRFIFNISSAGMLYKFQDPHYNYQNIFIHRPRIIHLPEHGCELKIDPTLYDAQYPMGFKHGLFIPIVPKRGKKAALTSITDKKFLSLLLNKLQDDNTLHSQCDQFLSQTLFFPFYYKHTNTFYLYLLALLKSSIVSQSEKNEIAIFSNIYYSAQSTTDAIDFNHIPLLHELYKSGIAKIELYANNEYKTINLTAILIAAGEIPKMGIPEQKYKKYKTLRIINYSLSSVDFNALFEIADYFGGGSGDKSLEITLANQLIPLNEIRSYKFKGMSHEISHVFSGTLMETLLIKKAQHIFNHSQFQANCIWHKNWQPNQTQGTAIIQLLKFNELLTIANEFAKEMTLENIKKTQEIIKAIIKTKNLYEILPTIFENEMKVGSLKNDEMSSTYQK